MVFFSIPFVLSQQGPEYPDRHEQFNKISYECIDNTIIYRRGQENVK